MLVEINNFLETKTMFKEKQIVSSNFIRYSLTNGQFPEITVNELNDNLVQIYIFMSIYDIDNEPIKVLSSDEFIERFKKTHSMFLL